MSHLKYAPPLHTTNLVPEYAALRAVVPSNTGQNFYDAIIGTRISGIYRAWCPLPWASLGTPWLAGATVRVYDRMGSLLATPFHEDD